MPVRTWKALRAISCICEHAVFSVGTSALINGVLHTYIRVTARNGPVGARGRETHGAPAYKQERRRGSQSALLRSSDIADAGGCDQQRPDSSDSWAQCRDHC